MENKLPVSVFMHVENEEKVIEDCLKSVLWADEIFMVDSYSTDATKKIAQKYTDKIINHKYINSAQQKNWCLENLPFRNQWVFLIDADERVTPELVGEIEKAIPQNIYDGFYINRKNYFLKREIKYCWNPDHQLRLFKHRMGRWDYREVHSELLIKGRIGYLENYIVHHTRDSIFSYIQKLNRHTSWEAEELFKKGGALISESDIPRPWWKRGLRFIWRFIPFKPFALFVYMYFFKLGFLDGYPGFLICVFQSFYVFLSYAKFREKKYINRA